MTPVQGIGRILRAWCAALPIQPADDSDLFEALDAVRGHQLAFWDAMLWASAQRAGVRHMLSEDFQDGFVLQDVTFINPFRRENDQLIDNLLREP
jgi:predicted nucleic acid-binding protein